MKRINLLIVTVFLGLFFKQTLAQSINETINNLSQQAAQSYVSPVVSAFSSNLNSAWFDSAPSAATLGFDLEIKASVSATFFNDSQKRFNSSGTFRFTSSQVDRILANSGIPLSSSVYTEIKKDMLSKDFVVNFAGPTIVGSDQEHLVISFPGANIQGQNIAATKIDINEVKGLLNNYKALPFGALQFSLGTVYGTKALIRWFPSVDVQDLGKITFFGWGIMHNLNAWTNNSLPVDISLGFFSQTLTVGDVFESTSTQYGAYLSKTFGSGFAISPFIGVTNENAKTTVKYDYSFDTADGPKTQHLQFDLNGDNSVAVTLGATLKLLILNISADYKMAKTNTASVSVYLSF